MPFIPTYPGSTPVTSSGTFNTVVGVSGAFPAGTAGVGTALVGSAYANGNLALRSGVVSQPTGTVTVSDNNFAALADLFIGPYHLISNVDYAVAGSASLTAANIITAINQFPGISASTGGGAVVNVEWEGGPNDLVVFKAINRSVSHANLVLSGDGFLTLGSPTLSTFNP